MKITKNEKEDLIAVLEEYLDVFKKTKKHQEIHKKEPCSKCKLVKKLLRKLKNGL